MLAYEVCMSRQCFCSPHDWLVVTSINGRVVCTLVSVRYGVALPDSVRHTGGFVTADSDCIS